MAVDSGRSYGAAATGDREWGPSAAARLMALIDRARHDPRFRADLRCEPVATVARLGLSYSAAEWHGPREPLTDS